MRLCRQLTGRHRLAGDAQGDADSLDRVRDDNQGAKLTVVGSAPALAPLH